MKFAQINHAVWGDIIIVVTGRILFHDSTYTLNNQLCIFVFKLII